MWKLVPNFNEITDKVTRIVYSKRNVRTHSIYNRSCHVCMSGTSMR